MGKIYAVRQGRQTGLFNTWAACEAQVKGYAGARYKGFTDAAAAMVWLQGSDGQTELFAERQAAGHICDCHGDLYSANICLADRVYIYDCIEFNQRFRYCDVASDVAFLAMDLDYHGLTQLSTYFIDRFVAASKDPGLLEMLNFYKGYRAYVRGKIGLFTASDPAVDAQFRTQCIDDATRYFRLAEQYATN